MSLDDPAEYTWVGSAMDALALVDLQHVAGWSDGVVVALLGAWQVTVFDPIWGRDDLLWEHLNRLGAEPAAARRRRHSIRLTVPTNGSVCVSHPGRTVLA